MQPEDPAGFGTKIYELMSSGVTSNRPVSNASASRSTTAGPISQGVTEAEILEPEVKPQSASA